MIISVIIPTYKPGDYIWECLDSLYNQTLSKDSFEIVIVLNGCDEPYNSQLREYMESHSEVNWRYLHTEQGGVSNARNLAMAAMAGEYVTFIDDDDYVSPKYLECLLDVADRKCVSISDTLSFEDGSSIMNDDYIGHHIFKRYSNKDNTINTLKFFFQGPVRKLIHRSMLQGREFDVSLSNGEDSLYMFLISDRIKFVKLTSPEAIYYRRIRTNSANYRQRSTREVINNRLYLIKEYSKIFVRHPLSYNALFYFTRVLGSINTIFHNLKNH